MMGACILHGDYHEMQAECIRACRDWNIGKESHPPLFDRDEYQQTVERMMLDKFKRTGVI